MLAEVDVMCGRLGINNAEWLQLRQAVDDFQRQKALLGQPYNRSGNKQYNFEMAGNLKVIDQGLYDQAAKDGFPPDFFRQSFFDKVTFYCLPDHTDFNFSFFNDCDFSVCRIREATFDGTKLYGTGFHNCAIRHATFFKATLSITHFHDSTLQKVSFQEARILFCNFIDCKLEDVGFLKAKLDGSFFGRVDAHNIRNLHTATITQSGATDEEVTHNREAILAALRPQPGERREAPEKKRGGR